MPPTVNVRRHEGVGTTVGFGVRSDVALPLFGESGVVPLALEVQYTKHFWSALEANPEDYDGALLAPERMHLDALSLVFSVGFMR